LYVGAKTEIFLENFTSTEGCAEPEGRKSPRGGFKKRGRRKLRPNEPIQGSGRPYFLRRTDREKDATGQKVEP